jgi:hypothetical protein
MSHYWNMHMQDRAGQSCLFLKIVMQLLLNENMTAGPLDLKFPIAR